VRLRRLGNPGAEIPTVVLDDGTVLDLSRVIDDFSPEFFASPWLETLRGAIAGGNLREVPDAHLLRIGPPISRPSAIICIGQNYAAHAAESGDETPSIPIVFFKHPNTIVGPHDNIHMPPRADSLDWEVELGIVMGRRARYLPTPMSSRDYIAGYVVSHDVSERRWQTKESGGQWSKGKSGETFNPLGPDLLTVDEPVDAQAVRLWSRVNGEARQDSTTADMVFSIDFLIWHLSQYMVLEPGDLINTGTPQGVAFSGRFPYLQIGDNVELGIDGLGTQRQLIVPAPQ